MKMKFTLLLLAATLSSAAHASKMILPDACGSDSDKFDVDTKKDQPPPAPPAEGKALIVFIETLEKSGNIIGTPTVRFGMDGSWVGADKGNAYFVLSVSPGEHHLCSNWNKTVGMATVTVEAGKVYYYQHKLSFSFTSGPMVLGGGAPGQAPPMVVGGGHSSQNSLYGMLDDEEGRYRVKASAVSTSKPQGKE